MTTQKKNEMLAGFMGFVKSNSSPGNIFTHPDKRGVFGSTGRRLLYDTSPDWLLPVWYKFRELELNIVSGREYSSFRIKVDKISDAFTYGSFADLYDALVEAVQWYNSIKQKENG